ncbi:hypothetical protein Taro_006087 [Colocasia esculenta]|uniref:Uncharacterized protein n=1 Tax=Colocasia esculenta TaxID=4460 RepID=A0A843TRN6_COLES|nr:hypothetical protein [Colocasia esculenta]
MMVGLLDHQGMLVIVHFPRKDLGTGSGVAHSPLLGLPRPWHAMRQPELEQLNIDSGLELVLFALCTRGNLCSLVVWHKFQYLSAKQSYRVNDLDGQAVLTTRDDGQDSISKMKSAEEALEEMQKPRICSLARGFCPMSSAVAIHQRPRLRSF